MLGKTLSGRYQIVQHLGGGGFGQTYLAQDLQLPSNPLCVVKQLKPKSTDPLTLQIAKRFFDREAEVLYKLGNHDQIPRLLAHFEQEQEFYLVQEFIDGNDLTQELPPGRRLTEAQVIVLCQELLKILEFVHQQDVIHRDIKPANIIRRKQDGKLVLIDFGAVKEVTTQTVNPEGHSSLTAAIGSPGYMPNEQLGGKPQFCSDIYAVGVLGIKALTGLSPTQLPQDLKTSELLWRDKWLNNMPPEQVQISVELADVLDKMVRYDYRMRYQTAEEALQAFEQLTIAYCGSTTASISPASSTSPVSSTASAEPFESTATYSRPAPVPGSPSNSPIEGDEPTQAPPSQQLPTPDASANSSTPQVGNNETSKPWVSQSRNKSSRLLAIGGGIATVLAVTVGIYYVQHNDSPPCKLPPRPAISASPRVLRETSNAWNNSEKISLANTNTVHLYDTYSHSAEVSSIAITPDGHLIASGSYDKTIKLWNLRTGQLLCTLTGHSKAIRSVAISPDGKLLASGSGDNTIKLWNLDTGQLLRTLTGHSDIVQSVTISPDGKLLASGGDDQTVKLWNLQTGQEIRTLIDPYRNPDVFDSAYIVYSLAISPDGQTLISGSNKKLYLWDLPTGNLIGRIDDPSASYINSLAIMPDGETLVSGSYASGGFNLWNLQILLKGCKGVQPCRPTKQILSQCLAPFAISPDGKTIAAPCQEKDPITLWNASTGERRVSLSQPSTQVWALAFSPDGKTLVANSGSEATSDSSKIAIWRAP